MTRRPRLDIGVPEATWSYAVGLLPGGGAVANVCFWNATGGGGLRFETWVWRGGRLPRPDRGLAVAVNGRGDILVSAGSPSPGYRTYRLLRQGKVIPLGPFWRATLSAMNNRGWIVGMARLDESHRHDRPCVLRSGKLEGLPIPRTSATGWARVINERGQIVGWASPGPARPCALLWENGRNRDLNGLIPKGSGWKLLSAAAISDRGWIAGAGEKAGKLRAYLLKPVH